jgi:hypothetical protein
MHGSGERRRTFQSAQHRNATACRCGAVSLEIHQKTDDAPRRGRGLIRGNAPNRRGAPAASTWPLQSAQRKRVTDTRVARPRVTDTPGLRVHGKHVIPLHWVGRLKVFGHFGGRHFGTYIRNRGARRGCDRSNRFISSIRRRFSGRVYAARFVKHNAGQARPLNIKQLPDSMVVRGHGGGWIRNNLLFHCPRLLNPRRGIVR